MIRPLLASPESPQAWPTVIRISWADILPRVSTVIHRTPRLITPKYPPAVIIYPNDLIVSFPYILAHANTQKYVPLVGPRGFATK